MNPLIKVRISSFLWSLGSLLGIAIAGVLISTDFHNLVVQHFGNTFTTSLILLFVPEIVKHIRNVTLTNKLGATTTAKQGEEEIILI